MAAKVQFVYSCPRCGEGLTSSALNVDCPSCKLPLGSKEITPYTPPYTLCEQHEKHKNAQQHLDALLRLSKEKCYSILNDSLNILETLPAKKAPDSDIRFLLGLAIRIGDIAKAYEKYLEAGGKHVPSTQLSLENTTSSQENTDELQPTSGDREAPSES